MHVSFPRDTDMYTFPDEITIVIFFCTIFGWQLGNELFVDVILFSLPPASRIFFHIYFGRDNASYVWQHGAQMMISYDMCACVLFLRTIANCEESIQAFSEYEQ